MSSKNNKNVPDNENKDSENTNSEGANSNDLAMALSDETPKENSNTGYTHGPVDDDLEHQRSTHNSAGENKDKIAAENKTADPS